MPTRPIPTANDLRALREKNYSGYSPAQLVTAAQRAISEWQLAHDDVIRQAADAGRDHFLASEKRRVDKAIMEKHALGKFITETEPMRASYDPSEEHERGIDDDVDLFGSLSSGDRTKVMAPAAWCDHVAKTLSQKAISSGNLTVPAVLSDYVADPQAAQGLLDLIPRKPISEVNYAYLQQTVRTNNAAPVADGQKKPTSVFTFREVTNKAEVVAHLSEPFPQRYISDHAELTQLLRSEMVYGLAGGVERQVTIGNGIPPSFTGVFAITGTTDVPWSNDAMTSLRKARTALQLKGEKPTAYVLNPLDVEGLDLTRENDSGPGSGQYLALKDNVFGPLPVVQSLAIPPGTGLLADWALQRLYIREQMSLQIDVSGDLFESNQARLRCEMRANFESIRPQSLALIDLGSESGYLWNTDSSFLYQPESPPA